MYQIAICDDDLHFVKRLQNEINRYFSHASESISVMTFTSGKQLINCNDIFFDLYFLDIRMPELSGFDLADRIRQEGKNSSIIFISSMYNAVFQSFRFSPLRFVRKEMMQEELSEALTAFLKLQKQNEESDFVIELSERRTTNQIPIRQIYYIELRGHYLDFHCQSQDYHVRGKLADYESLLSSHGFARIHQGCLVNLSLIRMVNSDMITLSDQKQLYISRNFKKSFQSAYMAWERKTSHVLTI